MKPAARNISQDGDKGDICGLECRLTETLKFIMKTECRIWLIKSLLKLDLCTRDIYFFALNQARMRVEDKLLDKQTVRAAMNTKLRDLRMVLTPYSDLRFDIENITFLNCYLTSGCEKTIK